MALAAGCSGGNPWASPEDRINEAFPPAATVSQVRAKLDDSFKGDAAAKARVDAELVTKLKLRALTCAEGKEPSLLDSAEDIRRKLAPDCFAKFDADLIAWLNSRRLSTLMSAAPLRPIPQNPPAILSTTNPINTIKFASDAGIAVAASGNTVEVIDIGNDESIFMDTALRFRPYLVEVAPNGRAFALSNSDAGGVTLRDSQTGEVLADYPEYTRFTWLDPLTALLMKRDGRATVELLDLASGKTTVAKGLPAAYARVVPAPDHKGQFVAGAYNSITKFELRRDELGVRIALLDQQNGPQMGWSDTISEPTSDGRFFVQAARDLAVTNLSTLKTEQISISMPNVYFQSATPLPDPTEMLLRTSVPVDANNHYFVVYSLKDRNFAPVDGDQMGGPSGYSGMRTVYVPSIRRVGIVSDKSIKLIDKLDRGFRYGPDAFAQRLQEVTQERQQKQAAETAQRMGYASSGSLNGVPIMAGPIAQLAKDAQIEALGVYEGVGSSKGAGASSVHYRVPITVVLRRSPKPIVLVLSSYEAIDWMVSIGPGAQLKAVLVASHTESTVHGAGAVRIVNIGSFYAYDRGSNFTQLQQEVVRWTGKTIDTFQGKYQGTTFLVGGN
jgi:hypothetical protein